MPDATQTLRSPTTANRPGRQMVVCLALALLTLFTTSCQAAEAPTPAATMFNQPTNAFAPNGDEFAVRRLVTNWSGALDSQSPTFDSNLGVVCRRVAQRLKKGGSESMSSITNVVVQEEMTRAGVSDAAIRTQMAQVPRLGDLERMLKNAIQTELSEGRYTHFGVGVSHQFFPRGYFVMLLFSRRPITLDPFPRQVADGERVELAGTLLGGLKNPRAYISKPSGVVRDVLLDIKTDGSFSTHIFFNEGPGVYRVEVSGDGSLGPEIVALMPIDVGKFEKKPPAEKLPLAKTEGQARNMVFQYINKARKDHGLPPFKRLGSLEQIAQSHAAEMSRLHYAAHRSPTTGMVTDRANKAGILWQRIGENVALNQSSLAAHISLMESPAHRANVLNAHFTHLGIGLVFADDGHGHRLVYLVENYMSKR